MPWCRLLIIVCVHAAVSKYPTPGKSKTRLVPDLGKDGASAFAEAALTDIVKRFSVTMVAACGCCSVIRLTRLLFVHPSERLATLWCSHCAAPNALVCTSWCQRSIHGTCRVVKRCYMHPWSFTPSCVAQTWLQTSVGNEQAKRWYLEPVITSDGRSSTSPDLGDKLQVWCMLAHRYARNTCTCAYQHPNPLRAVPGGIRECQRSAACACAVHWHGLPDAGLGRGGSGHRHSCTRLRLCVARYEPQARVCVSWVAPS